MLRIGLTGGIGSGKSTAAKLFRELGVTTIDLDQVSRDVVAKDTAALAEIEEHFRSRFPDSEILSKDGSLNREVMRDIVFSDEAARRWLESLLHPLIRERQAKLVGESQSDYVIIEIPLLAEKKLQDTVDRVLVVDVDEQNQIGRASERDNTDTKEIEAILNAQANRQERLDIADDVIDNNGNLDDLKTQIRDIHEIYTEMVSKTKG